jgi:hypothetical protein
MTDTHPVKDTHAKALAINLDSSIYGSFAEIGGGQEVARWFLTVGAASGSVAQTISAYDKLFSDDTYGGGSRYVSRERLLAMLDREYELLTHRLGPARGAQTRFFAFADTVATRNYKGDNDQHGWIGLRFQSQPLTEPSDLLLHVNLMDSSAAEQQNALGVLGVNLLYSAHHACHPAETFLDCLWDGLLIDRMEIDVLDFHGPAFQGQDPATWCLQLLRRKMARGIMFDREFRVVEPSGILRKRPLIVDRGRFETVEPFHGAMLESAGRVLRGEGVTLAQEPQALLEMAIHPIIDDDSADDAAILARVRQMLKLAPALVSALPEGFRLVPYLRRYSAEPIRLVGGVTLLARMLQAQFYDALPGTLMEGLGKLFASNVTFYVYPMSREAIVSAIGDATGKVRVPARSVKPLLNSDDLEVSPPMNHLYRYLREAGRIVLIDPP